MKAVVLHLRNGEPALVAMPFVAWPWVGPKGEIGSCVAFSAESVYDDDHRDTLVVKETVEEIANLLDARSL